MIRAGPVHASQRGARAASSAAARPRIKRSEAKGERTCLCVWGFCVLCSPRTPPFTRFLFFVWSFFLWLFQEDENTHTNIHTFKHTHTHTSSKGGSVRYMRVPQSLGECCGRAGETRGTEEARNTRRKGGGVEKLRFEGGAYIKVGRGTEGWREG